jgi:cytoskeleton protein RodZ
MRRGIDLTEVESVTKIRARYLRAMEDDEWSVLPGPTYVRSFLRTYAEYLGLDPHLVVQEYRTRYESDRDDELPLTRRRPLERRSRRPGPGLTVGALLVALLAFLFILGQTSEDPQPPPERPEAAVETSDRKDRGSSRRERRRERRARPRRVSLIVAPVEPTYLCVDDGAGTTLFEGIVTERQVFRRRRLRVNLGRPTAVVRVNGRRIRPESLTNPVGYDLRPGRRPRDLPSGRRPCA